MIIWINGPFGAGKTTIALMLKKYFDSTRRNLTRNTLPDTVSPSMSPATTISMLFDPECIGSFLRELIAQPASDDYQDIPLWREMTINNLIMLHKHYPHSYIIVPMTLVNPTYLTEIFEQLSACELPLIHIWLKVPAAVLQARIKEQIFFRDPIRDAEIAKWRSCQIQRCLAAAEYLPSHTQQINGELSPIEVLESVIHALADYIES